MVWKVLLVAMALLLIMLAITLVRYRWWQEADTEAYHLTLQLRQAHSQYQMLHDDFLLARQRHQRIIADIRAEQERAHQEELIQALDEDLRAAQNSAAAADARYTPMLEELAASIAELRAALDQPARQEEPQP